MEMGALIFGSRPGTILPAEVAETKVRQRWSRL